MVVLWIGAAIVGLLAGWYVWYIVRDPARQSQQAEADHQREALDRAKASSMDE